jgi:hypothetical protein
LGRAEVAATSVTIATMSRAKAPNITESSL